MTALRLIHLPEPNVEFGEGESSTIREGLAEFGPYSLRLGAAHPSAVRIGIVGTPESVAGARSFLQRMASRIHSGRPNVLLTPDYPGFAEVFRSSLAVEPRWVVELDAASVEEALALPPYGAFEACLGLWAEGVRGWFVTSPRMSSCARYRVMFWTDAERSMSPVKSEAPTDDGVAGERGRVEWSSLS